MGAIGKRESENEVVWIKLRSRELNWKKVRVTKVKGYGRGLMFIFYADPNHRYFFKFETVQYKEKKNDICSNCYHAAYNPLPNFL